MAATASFNVRLFGLVLRAGRDRFLLAPSGTLGVPWPLVSDEQRFMVRVVYSSLPKQLVVDVATRWVDALAYLAAKKEVMPGVTRGISDGWLNWHTP